MRWHKRLITATGLALAVGVGLAEEGEEKLTAIEYRPRTINVERGESTPEQNISMPYFLPSKHGIVADRINQVLFSAESGLPVPSESEAASPTTIHQRSDSDQYSYSIVRNDSKVLSVEIHSEGCRASCAANNNNYNFEAETGRYIPLSLLFSKAGLKSVSNSLIKTWSKQIKKEYDGNIDECIASMKSNYGRNTPYTGFDFIIRSDGITFRRGGCWKIDGPYSKTFKAAEIVDSLTPYGKYIFLGQEHTSQPLSIHNQFLEGHIGNKYEFKMRLIEGYPSAGYFIGSYSYKKYNKPISLVAWQKENKIEIHEDANSDPSKRNKIFAAEMGDEYVGYWTDGKRKLDFKARISAP